MQIHEVTRRALTENILRTIGQDIKGAVTTPFQKLGAILDTPGAMTDPRLAGAALDRREQAQAQQTLQQQQVLVQQQTQKRARDLAQQWAAKIKADTKQPTAPFAGQAAPLPTVTVNGKLLTKGPDGLWHGEDGRAVTDPAQIAKLDKAYYTGMTKQKGIVKERRQRRKLQQPQKKSTTTSATPPMNDPLGFVAWSDEQLTGTASGTRQEINMDRVRQDSQLAQPVQAALARVLQDPQNITAVQQYLVTAMQAMQALSSKIRQRTPRQPLTTPNSVLSQVVNPQQLQDLKRLAQDPVKARQLQSELGFRE